MPRKPSTQGGRALRLRDRAPVRNDGTVADGDQYMSVVPTIRKLLQTRIRQAGVPVWFTEVGEPHRALLRTIRQIPW
jgi:hypothetical protein